MMGNMPPHAMGGMTANAYGHMPPEAMAGMDGPMMHHMPQRHGWYGTTCIWNICHQIAWLVWGHAYGNDATTLHGWHGC